MKVLALTVAVLALSAASVEAQQLSCTNAPSHYSAPGQIDNGRTVVLPKGGTQTTYVDGWTHASEPDDTYGKGGRRTTDKDNTGVVRTITKCDAKNVVRQAVQSENQNGVIVTTLTSWNAAGAQISKETRRTAAASLPPQGQQAQPVQSAPPPSGYPSAGAPPPPPPPPGDQTMNGPPPGSDPNGPPPGYDPNGPPPGYDSGGPPPYGPPVGIGGFGFSFGTRHRF